jgi:NitT/TauT family transport system substrate-binding protein
MYVDAIKKLSPHFVTIDNVKNVVTQKVTKTLSKKDRVVISVGSQPIGALVYIALMNGYFAENGLDVVLKKYLTGKSALDAAINGESDLATTADTPIVFSVLGGTKLNIVATIGTSNRNIAIIASSKNKAISNIESLRGKRVGVTFGTNGQYFLDKMLVKHGLSTSDITAVDVRPADMLQALSSGKVDAVATWYPHRLTIQNQLPDVLEFSNRTVYTWYWNLVGRSAYVLTHKKLINRILKSLLQAQNFIEHNPILARHKVLEYLKISAKNDSKLWDVADYGLELSPGLISTLKEQAKWAVRLRLVPNQKIPNFKEDIYWQGLREVSPDSVKVY